MKKYTLSVMLLLAVSLLSIKCSKDKTPPTMDGNWNGTTSQGKPFSFAVEGGVVTYIHIAYTLTGNCLPLPIQSDIFGRFNISGNSFTTTSGDISITGTFSSTKNATGTFAINYLTGNPPGCSSTASGTWTATK